MGGLAFADEEPCLPTPRMPFAVYSYVRDDLLRTVRKFYAQAECPIEAPGKSDYGDVDMLVAQSLQDLSSEQLAVTIGAVKYKKTGGSQTTHFAIPWPEMQDASGSTDAAATGTSESVAKNQDRKYIQLDLHLCTRSSFGWEVFHQAHGDFWNIIASTVRPLGLTPSISGFYVRIQEIETRNRQAARILLTTSPSDTLSFLGLDPGRYWRKFETVDELFAYAATCRFFDPKRYDAARTRADLKANDRKRARKRAVFRKWIDEYLPLHVDDEPADAAAAAMSREDVVGEAKSFFGVADEYDERRSTGVREMGRDRLWKQIRKELGIEDVRVGAVVRGVKREVVSGQGKPEADMTALQRAYLEDDFDRVVECVRDSWRDIEERQRAYEGEKNTQNLLAKLEKAEIGERT